MDKKWPKKSPKGKAKKDQEEAKVPYKIAKLKTTSHCFVDVETLHQKGTCIFMGEYKDHNNKKVQVMTLLATFQELKKMKNTKRCTKQWGSMDTSICFHVA